MHVDGEDTILEILSEFAEILDTCVGQWSAFADRLNTFD